MKKLKLVLVGLLLAVMVLGLMPGIVVSASELGEYYNTGADEFSSCFGTTWQSQTFTPLEDYTVTSVKMKLRRYGSNPGTVTLSIVPTVDTEPQIYSDLAVGTINGNTIPLTEGGTWTEITMNESYDLLEGVLYGIVIRAVDGDSNNAIYTYFDGSDPTYARGCYWMIAGVGNGGPIWYQYISHDYMFETWGDFGPVAPSCSTQDVTDIYWNPYMEWWEGTFHGTVTDDGGEPCIAGFMYKVQSEGEWDEWAIGGTYETDETFGDDFMNFDEGAYDVKAYVQNSIDIAYGNVVEFSTEMEAGVPEIRTLGWPMVKGETDCRIYGDIGNDGESVVDVWFNYRLASEEPWEFQPVTNLISNHSFEDSFIGHWDAVGAGATFWRRQEEVKEGSYSGRLLRAGSDCSGRQIIDNWERYKGEQLTLAGWVWSSTANTTRLWLNDGIGNSYSPEHSGSSTWEWLSVTRTIDGSATSVTVFLKQMTSDIAVYFDDVVLVRGDTALSTALVNGEWLETGEQFNYLLEGLTPDVYYEFKAGGGNDEGISYGGIASFILRSDITIPEVRTDPAKFVRATEARLYGKTIDDGGMQVTHWIEYRRSGDVDWLTTVAGGSYTDETWSRKVTNLVPEKSYQFRAYGKNEAGEHYGDIRVFGTYEAERVPVIKTNEAENIDTVSMRLCCSLEFDGGSLCDVYFQYRLLGDSEWVETDATSGVESGYDVEHVITYLKSGFWYEYRALASNDIGIGYGVTMSSCVVEEGIDPGDEPLDPIGGVDEWLSGIGLANEGGHWLIMLVVMGATFGIFRKSRVLKVVFPLCWLGFFMAVGWIAIWIVVLLALGAGVTAFSLLRKQAAGGG